MNSSTKTTSQTQFDPKRATLKTSDMFPPLYVKSTISLSSALQKKILNSDTPVLVIEISGKALALHTVRMAHHHVAQGEFAGEPWLVSF